MAEIDVAQWLGREHATGGLVLLGLAATTIGAPVFLFIICRLCPSRTVKVLALYPLVEELAFRMALAAGVMTALCKCPAEATVVVCTMAYSIAHLGIIFETKEPIRAVDGPIVGLLNTALCLLYFRFFASNATASDCVAGYMGLVGVHVFYNALTLLSPTRLLVRVAGLVFAAASCAVWLKAAAPPV